MKQWTHEEFCRMVERNGFYYMRSKGSHSIYVNKEGHHMSIPKKKLACVIARRLIKENKLDTNLKKKV